MPSIASLLCLSGYVLENLKSEVVELLHCWDEHSFVGSVGTDECRTITCHVHLWIVDTDDAAFETCVACADDRLLGIQLLIDVGHHLYEWALWVWLPAAVATLELDVHACHGEA